MNSKKPRKGSVRRDQQRIIDAEFDEIVGFDAVFHSPQGGDYKTLEPQSGLESDGYAGQRPKNYIRPDVSIHDDVVELLTRHPEVNVADVEVQVDSGEVILTGFVPEEKMKFLAAEVIKKVPGVKEVSNQLKLLKDS